MLTTLLLLLVGASDTTHAEVLSPSVVITVERESKIIVPEPKVAEFVAKDWDVIEETRPNDPPMECCYDYKVHQ